ncbi:MAG: hypothetical protein HY529_03125 [Chloroflexi bacterium]|nr:hypothetical protein [Chloroflexota bacterium]
MEKQRMLLAARLFSVVSIAALLVFNLGNKPDGEPYHGKHTMFLTDEPGNWFKSAETGTPVLIIDRDERVQFDRGTQTGTKHTVTLLIQPTGSDLAVDQNDAGNGKISADFNVPGVYLFVCKVHPYMTGVVAVKDAGGNIPPVTKEQLPFIGHLGVDSLDAGTVLSVLRSIAPTDADKQAKWNIFTAADEFKPAKAGVGEVWIDTQFERVPGQMDDRGDLKPGSITVVNVDKFTTTPPFTVEREINGLDPDAAGLWNNPHNMWANTALNTIYNGNWFGKSLNRIDRASGDIRETIVAGEAPTHIVTIPGPSHPHFGVLTLPLSAEQDMDKIQDRDQRLKIIDHFPTGAGLNHPHAQWITSDGNRIVVPNVFKGLGVAGSISILDAANGNILKEFNFSPLGLNSALLLPIATGIKGSSKAYIANGASGQVTVIDLVSQQLIKNIPVTFTPDGQQGPQFTIFDTLQFPIQTPVSPDGKFAGTAVLSLTTVGRPPTGSADHIAIIDTATDQAVKFLATPAGTHGANWGAKKGGGYYLYVSNQFANVLTVIDPDPNNDGSAADAAVVGRILLANGSFGATVTDGTGGQGIKPLPNMYPGWIQDTVALSGTGQLSAEVQGWIDELTAAQKNPSP